MPVYSFRDVKTNEPLELFLTWAQFDALERIGTEYLVDGQLLKRDLRADLGNHQATPSNWPQESEAFGCGPHEVAEHAKAARDRGVELEYTPQGKAVFRDRAHRKKVLSAFGFRDNDGGYGD